MDVWSLRCYLDTSKDKIKAARLFFFFLEVCLALIICKGDNEATLREI